ncbi:hypothetical protein L7F22_038592 [Adiantum nelumboides]|nr:hypothetical protein [Adiantum nelumboides]
METAAAVPDCLFTRSLHTSNNSGEDDEMQSNEDTLTDYLSGDHDSAANDAHNSLNLSPAENIMRLVQAGADQQQQADISSEGQTRNEDMQLDLKLSLVDVQYSWPATPSVVTAQHKQVEESQALTSRNERNSPSSASYASNNIEWVAGMVTHECYEERFKIYLQKEDQGKENGVLGDARSPYLEGAYTLKLYKEAIGVATYNEKGAKLFGMNWIVDRSMFFGVLASTK